MARVISTATRRRTEPTTSPAAPRTFGTPTALPAQKVRTNDPNLKVSFDSSSGSTVISLSEEASDAINNAVGRMIGIGRGDYIP